MKVSGDKDSPERFTGFYLHDPSGLALTLARAYNPGIGRWISHDLLASGPNAYDYIAGSPIDGADPLGLFDMSAWPAVRTLAPVAGGAVAVDGPVPVGDIIAGVIVLGAGICDLFDCTAPSPTLPPPTSGPPTNMPPDPSSSQDPKPPPTPSDPGNVVPIPTDDDLDDCGDPKNPKRRCYEDFRRKMRWLNAQTNLDPLIRAQMQADYQRELEACLRNAGQ